MAILNDASTVQQLTVTGGTLGTAFFFLFKSNRDSIKAYKTQAADAEERLAKLEAKYDQLEKKFDEQDKAFEAERRDWRHDRRALQIKLEAYMTRDRIQARYLLEAGIDMREEDRKLFEEAFLPGENK